MAWRALTAVSTVGFFPLFILTLKLISWFPLLLEGSLFVFFSSLQLGLNHSSAFFKPLYALLKSLFLDMSPMTGVSVSYNGSSIFTFLFKQEETPPLLSALWALLLCGMLPVLALTFDLQLCFLKLKYSQSFVYIEVSWPWIQY